MTTSSTPSGLTFEGLRINDTNPTIINRQWPFEKLNFGCLMMRQTGSPSIKVKLSFFWLYSGYFDQLLIEVVVPTVYCVLL